METFEEYLETMDNVDQRMKMETILSWIGEQYPQLVKRIAWNQPMYTHDGTFIIGFSYSKHHIALSPEVKPIEKFIDEIQESGLSHTKNIIRIKWEDEIPYSLMKTLIEYNIEDKAGYEKFWR